MPLLPVYEWLGLDVKKRTKRILTTTAFVILGFVAIDAGIIHPIIWENDPSLLYWLAKPVWVGAPMLAAVWWFLKKENASLTRALLAGALLGVISLQLYYTVIPIPIDGGGAIQIGLVGNLTEGLVVHFGGIAIAVIAAVFLYRKMKVVRD